MTMSYGDVYNMYLKAISDYWDAGAKKHPNIHYDIGNMNSKGLND